MPKRRRPRRSDRPAAIDVVSQLECAIRRPQAALIGALVGGLVPWFARSLAHEQLPATWSAGHRGLAVVMLLVILGCSVFSALSVYKFGLATFGDARKAVGFAIALEGVMVVSHGVTSAVALAALVLINALGNGATIALARDATCKRRESAARGAASRRERARKQRAPQFVPPPAPRRRSAPAKTPAWYPDVVDAEIVSETRLLA